MKMIVLICCSLLFANASFAQQSVDIELLRKQTIEKGLKYLQENGQAEDGSFTARAGAGITALAVTAAIRNGKTLDDPMVAKGLKALEGFVKPDGGIYGGGRLKNYETCVALVAFVEANTKGQYSETIANARKFLTDLQGGNLEKGKEDPWYGGVGYAGKGRPDLSNTAYFIEALRASGAEANDPAVQKALVFVLRCQNQTANQNAQKLVEDGGFFYELPQAESSDEESKDGSASYGSMTYSGLKSMVYAGLTENDPRVKATVAWIRQKYSVTENPGKGQAGLYYYYQTFGAAFNAAKLSNFKDGDGEARNWKHDLVKALAERQKPNGSWENSNKLWFENDPNLATSFALITLSYCQPESK